MGDQVMALTESNFAEQVINSEIPVLVDFWAAWCGPCRMVAPIIEEIAKEYAGRLKVGKVNVDEQANLAAQYGIRSIPTLMFFKGGRLKDQTIGAQPKEALKAFIDKNL